MKVKGKKMTYHIKDRPSVMVFRFLNTLVLGGAALMCIALLLHVVALSFSNNDAIVSNDVTFFPVGFTIAAYKKLLENTRFWTAFGRSVLRVLLGLLVNMTLVISCAYPLAKYPEQFKSRNFYFWFFYITALFSGGMIPTYVVINELGLMDSLWALVLPTGVSMGNIILLLNFIRQLPKGMLEAAEMDGAGELTKILKIVIPCCKPSLASIVLFTIVGHWNSWFDGMLYSTTTEKYPLQSYLQLVVVQQNFTAAGITDPEALAELSNTTMQTAQIVVAMIPVLLVYPFFQKYFMSGIVLGSVKE